MLLNVFRDTSNRLYLEITYEFSRGMNDQHFEETRKLQIGILFFGL